MTLSVEFAQEQDSDPLVDLEEAVDAWAASVDDEDLAVESLVAALHATQSVRSSLAHLEDRLNELVVAKAPAQTFEVPCIGFVQIKRSSARKAWQHDELLSLVARKASEARVPDPETGEVESEAEAVLREVRACAGFSYWKVGELRVRGIDPDEYVETTPGVKKAVIL